mmetsp:Transcript_13475/g.33013  ORF Transcript_13475/g.33013 Transcript_13475/m.33013 type:complete len:784 (-) Transcript_13475:2299-4650(-)
MSQNQYLVKPGPLPNTFGLTGRGQHRAALVGLLLHGGHRRLGQLVLLVLGPLGSHAAQRGGRVRAGVVHQLVEHGPGHAQQVVGRVKLLELAAGHGQDLVGEDDGVQAVGNGDGGAALEHAADGLLDEAVGLQVHGSRGLVQHQDARLLEHAARHAHQLLLAQREVGAALGHCSVQAARQLRHRLLHVHQLQGLPHLVVGRVAEGVQVGAHGALEHDGLLGDDGQAAAHLAQRHPGNVLAVNHDAAHGQLKHAEQRHEQRGLAGAGAAHHADLLTVLDVEGDELEREGRTGVVAQAHLLKLDVAGGGPVAQLAAILVDLDLHQLAAGGDVGAVVGGRGAVHGLAARVRQHHGALHLGQVGRDVGLLGDVGAERGDALHGVPHGHGVGHAAHHPREEHQHLDGVGDGQAYGGSAHVLLQAHREQAGGHHQHSAKEVAPEGQPQVALLGVEQGEVVGVDARHVLLDEEVDGVKRLDDLHAVQRLVHVHIHLGCGLAGPALERGGGGQVQELHDAKRAKQGRGEGGVVVDRHGHNGQRRQQDHQVDERHVQRVGQRLVQRVLVLGKAVEHVADRRAQEEQDGRLEHFGKQVVVQLGGAADVPHGEHGVTAQQHDDKAQHQCQVAQDVQGADVPLRVAVVPQAVQVEPVGIVSPPPDPQIGVDAVGLGAGKHVEGVQAQHQAARLQVHVRRTHGSQALGHTVELSSDLLRSLLHKVGQETTISGLLVGLLALASQLGLVGLVRRARAALVGAALLHVLQLRPLVLLLLLGQVAQGTHHRVHRPHALQ